MKTFIAAARNMAAQTIDVYVHRADVRGSTEQLVASQVTYLGAPISECFMWSEYEQGCVSTPAFRLTSESAQRLMDDLYRSGFRPTDAQGTAGQLEAMKAHLDDMRKAYELVLMQAKVASTPMMFIQEPTR